MRDASSAAARARSAEVTIVAGARLLCVTSAEEMRAAVKSEINQATIFIAAAAVADYRPIGFATQKIKKTGDGLTLQLEPTPDILAEVAAAPHDNLIVVGFAAETNDVLQQARAKLERKQLDAVVANNVTQPGAGFDIETNIITIITRDKDEPIELPLLSKRAAADHILDEVIRLRRQKPIAFMSPELRAV